MSEQQPLVSIITPCLNGEAFVHRYFDSVLAQTYQNIELIFVNDGSTDKTEEIALRYKEKLEARGIQTTYIYQENQGLASSINTGLAVFRGDYLTWPDSDDWMTPDCIEKKVRYLETHPEKGFVLCKTAMVSEAHLERIFHVAQRKNTADGWLFDDLIFENDIYFVPGGYMVRSKILLNIIPQRRIYASRAGQNWQMLLPIAYRYECGFLDDILYYCVARANSLSSMETQYPELVSKTYRQQAILDHVLLDIDMPEEERQEYLGKIRIKYIHRRLQLAAQFHQRDAAIEEYENLLRENAATRQDRQDYLRGRYRSLDLLYKTAMLPARIVKKLGKIIRRKPT